MSQRGVNQPRLIPLKDLRSSFENLRTNGGAVEIIGDVSVLLSLSKYEPVEAFLGFSAESELRLSRAPAAHRLPTRRV